MKICIFDLDGTIALIDHRRHLLKDKNWDEFHHRCVDDLPNEPIIKLMHILSSQYLIYIFSGRSKIVERETIFWLIKHTVPCSILIMRDIEDFTPDQELKRKWLHELVFKEDIFCVFDDRQKVVDMWREEGLTCLQVAPGNF